MSWERLVAPAAAVVAGLGISAWLFYLDSRRKLRPRGGGRSSPPVRGFLDAGLTLVAVGVISRLLTGTDRGWPALAGYLPVLGGIALVAVHATQVLFRAFDGDGERRRRD